MRSIFFSAIILSVATSVSGAEMTNLPTSQSQPVSVSYSATPRVRGTGNLEATWYTNYGAREYWNNQRNPKQIWVYGANFIDPASLPDLFANPGKKHGMGKRRIKKTGNGKAATKTPSAKASSQGPCPPGYICVPEEAAKSAKLDLPAKTKESSVAPEGKKSAEKPTPALSRTGSIQPLKPDNVNTPLQ